MEVDTLTEGLLRHTRTFYDGDSALSFGQQMFAVPIAERWAVRK